MEHRKKRKGARIKDEIVTMLKSAGINTEWETLLDEMFSEAIASLPPRVTPSVIIQGENDL